MDPAADPEVDRPDGWPVGPATSRWPSPRRSTPGRSSGVTRPRPARRCPAGRGPSPPGRRPGRRPRPLGDIALRDALPAGEADPLQRLAHDPELDRRGPVGLWLLGHSLEMTGDHDRAFDVLRRARRTYPDDYWLNTELGLASLGGDPLGTRGHQCLDSSPRGIPDARYQRAEPYFMAAVALRPRSGTARLLLATAMLSQGKWDECFAEFREALRLQPDDPTIHNSLGVAYQARGEPSARPPSSARRSASSPPIRSPRGNLGDLLLSQGRPEEAPPPSAR